MYDVAAKGQWHAGAVRRKKSEPCMERLFSSSNDLNARTSVTDGTAAPCVLGLDIFMGEVGEDDEEREEVVRTRLRSGFGLFAALRTRVASRLCPHSSAVSAGVPSRDTMSVLAPLRRRTSEMFSSPS